MYLLWRAHYIGWCYTLAGYACCRPYLCRAIHLDHIIMHTCVQVGRVIDLEYLHRLVGYLFHIMRARAAYIRYVVVSICIVL